MPTLRGTDRLNPPRVKVSEQQAAGQAVAGKPGDLRATRNRRPSEVWQLAGPRGEARPVCSTRHTTDWKCHYLLFTTTEDKRLHTITDPGNSC